MHICRRNAALICVQNSYLPNVRCYVAKKSHSDESMVAYHNKDITKAASRRYLDNLFFKLYLVFLSK